MRRDDSAYQSWLWGEILLFGLLAAGLALFAAYPDLRPTYELPQARLVLDTMVALAAALVALLAGVRLSVDGRRPPFGAPPPGSPFCCAPASRPPPARLLCSASRRCSAPSRYTGRSSGR